jgi:hypothetical protein
MLVRVVDNGGKRERIGAERWTVEWWTLRDGVDDDGPESPDPDNDIIAHCVAYETRQLAEKRARRIVRDGDSYYGYAAVQRQAVDWLCENDGIAEWSDVGDPIPIDEPAKAEPQRCALCGAFYPRFKADEAKVTCKRCGVEWERG